MWGLIGRILLGTLIAGAAIVIISGIIDERKLREKMRERNIKRALIEQVDRTNNKVKLKDLDSSEYTEFEGEGISSDIRQGQKLYA